MDILTHMLTATTAAATVATFKCHKTSWKLAVVGMGLVAGALPDIDVISMWSGFDSTFGQWFSLTTKGREIYSAKYWYSHHAFMHSLLAVTILSVIVALLFATLFRSAKAAWIGVAFGCGYLSHLIGDMVTPSGPWKGIALFFPSNVYVGGFGKVWWWNNYDVFLCMAMAATASLMVLFVKSHRISNVFLWVTLLATVSASTIVVTAKHDFNKGPFLQNEQKSLQIQQKHLPAPIYNAMWRFDKKLKIQL